MIPGRPRKYFGQHFLHDGNIVDKIVAAISPEPGEHFVEIGPGRGALTRPLLDHGVNLDVIEIDQALADELASDENPQLTVHRANALKFDFSVIATDAGSLRLAGNLPYNISSPLLFHVLASADLFRDLHVMLQKEVVSRMAASPGTKVYGRLTVALAARCEVEPLFDIRPGSFTPAPRVESTFVRLTPNADLRDRIDNETAFNEVLRRAFGMRRKRLGNALQGLVSESQMGELGIDANDRAEQLSVDSFIDLGNMYARNA